MLGHNDDDKVIRFSDLYEILKSYPSTLEVRYMIDEALKAPPPPLISTPSTCFSTRSPIDRATAVSCFHEKEKDAGLLSSAFPDLHSSSIEHTKKGLSEVLPHGREQTEWTNLVFQAKVEEEVRKLIKRSPHLFHPSSSSFGTDSGFHPPPLSPACSETKKDVLIESSPSIPGYTEKVSPVKKRCLFFNSDDSVSRASATVQGKQRASAPLCSGTSSHSPFFNSTAHSSKDRGRECRVDDLHMGEVSLKDLEKESQAKKKNSNIIFPDRKDRIAELEDSLQELRSRVERSEKDFNILMEALVSLSFLHKERNYEEENGREKISSSTKGRKCRGILSENLRESANSSSGSSNGTREGSALHRDLAGDFFNYELPPHQLSSKDSSFPASSWPTHFCSPSSLMDSPSCIFSASATDHVTGASKGFRSSALGVGGPRPLWREALNRQDVPALCVLLGRALHPRFSLLATEMNEKEAPDRTDEEEGQKRGVNNREKRGTKESAVWASSLYSSPVLHSSDGMVSLDFEGQPQKRALQSKENLKENAPRSDQNCRYPSKDRRSRHSSIPLSSHVPSTLPLNEKNERERSCLLREQENSFTGVSTSSHSISHTTQTEVDQGNGSCDKDEPSASSPHSLSSKSTSLSLPFSCLPSSSGGVHPFSSTFFTLSKTNRSPKLSKRLHRDDHIHPTVPSSSSSLSSCSSASPFGGSDGGETKRAHQSHHVLGIHAVDVPSGSLDVCIAPLLNLEWKGSRASEEQQTKATVRSTSTKTTRIIEKPGEDRMIRRSWSPLGKGKEHTDGIGRGKVIRWTASSGLLSCNEPDFMNTEEDRARVHGGVRVVKVDPESLAEKAGLLPGDVVLEIAPFGPVHNCTMLAQVVRRHKELLELGFIDAMGYSQHKTGKDLSSAVPPVEPLSAWIYRPMVPRLLHIPLRW